MLNIIKCLEKKRASTQLEYWKSHVKNQTEYHFTGNQNLRTQILFVLGGHLSSKMLEFENAFLIGNNGKQINPFPASQNTNPNS